MFFLSQNKQEITPKNYMDNINKAPILGSTMAPDEKKRPTSPHFRYVLFFVFMVNLSTYSGKKQHGCSSVAYTNGVGDYYCRVNAYI